MKYSLAVSLLLSNARAQDAVAADGPPADYIAQADDFNNRMDTAIADAEAGIPAQVEMPGNAGVVDVNQAAVRDMMEVERRFWQNDAPVLEQAVQTALIEPLQRAEIRIAASMASILQPASEMLPLVGKMFPNSATCDVPAFTDCVWNNGGLGPDVLFGECAQTHSCSPEVGGWRPTMTPEERAATEATEGEIRDRERQMQEAVGRLSNAIDEDFRAGRDAARQAIQPLAEQWAQETQRIMVDDWGCDPQCMGETQWDRVNPAEFAQGGVCGCTPPVQPGQPQEEFQVVDWTAADFYTVSMVDWMNIHNEQQQKNEEVINLESEVVEEVAAEEVVEETPVEEVAEEVVEEAVEEAVAEEVAEEVVTEEIAEEIVEEAAIEEIVEETIELETTPAATEESSGAVWWVVGILAVLGLGGGAFWYKKKQS